MASSSVSSIPDKTKLSYIAVAFFLLVVVGWYIQTIYIRPHGAVDFSIYRYGAMTIFDNEGYTKNLYDPDLIWLNGSPMPFTYPPFAALVFIPFAFVPFKVAYGMMLIIIAIIAWYVATVIYNYIAQRGYTIWGQEKMGRLGTIALIAFLTICSGPWAKSADLGQINPILLTLVLADFVRPATRVPRGFLIGLAAGIKLVPLVFGLILLIRRDWKGIITLGLSFVGTILLGFILLPNDAPKFWFESVTNVSRVGDINFVDNISIQGWLMHFGLRDPMLKYTYYLIAVLAIALTAIILYQLQRREMVLSQVGITGLLMVSLSPISWSHHFVWFPIVIVALIVDAFPVFFKHLSKPEYIIAQICAWVGCVGLYISPRVLGDHIWGHLGNLNHYIPNVVIGALPIFCLFIVAIVILARASLTKPIRQEKEMSYLSS